MMRLDRSKNSMSADVSTVLAGKTTPQVLYQGLKEKANIQSENVWKIHGLSQKRLLPLEVQRISSILENCINQIEITTTLPAAHHNDSGSGAMSKEMSRALRVYQMIGVRLETLHGPTQESDEAEEDVVEAKRRAKDQLERDFKNSVRDLLRLFRAHPDAVFSLRREFGVVAGGSECILVRGLNKFHDHMIEKLQISQDKEQQLISCEQVSSSPPDDMEHMVKLKELAASIKQIDAEISERNLEIQTLESCLQENNAKEADWSPLADKQCQLHIKTSKMKQASIQQEINRLNIQLDNLILENQETEKVLREKNKKDEREIEYLLQTFGDDIEKNQANLEMSEMGIEREEGELRELEKPYAVLEAEFNQIQERRRLAEEKRKEDMRELELKTKAVIFAQAWWRGYSTREALKSKTKSKKAKKGKGKGNK